MPIKPSDKMAWGKKNENKVQKVVKKPPRIFKCTSCSYSSYRSSNLQRHQQTMHSELVKKMECCGIQFATKCEKRKHSKTAHKNGYTCEFENCNKTFKRKILLDRHYYSHIGIKNFKCGDCNYATGHKSNMMRHCKVFGHFSSQVVECKQIPRRRKNSTATSIETSLSELSLEDSHSRTDALKSESTFSTTSIETPIDGPMRKLKRYWCNKHVEETFQTFKKEMQVGKEEMPSSPVCDTNEPSTSSWTPPSLTYEPNYAESFMNNNSNLHFDSRQTDQKMDEESQVERLQTAQAMVDLSRSSAPAVRLVSLRNSNPITSNMLNDRHEQRIYTDLSYSRFQYFPSSHIPPVEQINGPLFPMGYYASPPLTHMNLFTTLSRNK